MTKFETRTFKVDETVKLSLLEPVPGLMAGSEPYYMVIMPPMMTNDPLINSKGNVVMRSKLAPLIVWGINLTDHMPVAWFNTIERAKAWKLPVNQLFNGATISVRIGLFEGFHSAPGNTLLGVQIHDMKPSKAALEWLEEQIAERKAWFNG